jgi:hypothetical protein
MGCAVLFAAACGAPSRSVEGPEPVEYDVEESPDPADRTGEAGKTDPVETGKEPTEDDKWAKLYADLEKKAAAEPDVVHGAARITKVVRCGGMAPPPDEPYSITNPWNGEILVRKGDENSTDEPVAAIQSQGQGVFAVKLPAGTYCLVRASKKDKPSGKAPMYVDGDCLLKEWKECDAVVEHPSGEPVYLSIFEPCFGPCYHGPMPP